MVGLMGLASEVRSGSGSELVTRRVAGAGTVVGTGSMLVHVEGLVAGVGVCSTCMWPAFEILLGTEPGIMEPDGDVGWSVSGRSMGSTGMEERS